MIFGGIQMIAGGSFLQFPPVPSLFDPGFYAFQSDKFMQTFLHRIQLDVVMWQDEQDLINVINKLCIGNPSDTSVQLKVW